MAVVSRELYIEPVEELEFLRPGSGLSEEFDLMLRELQLHGFAVAIGTHLSQQPRLAAMSREDHIREFCPDDIATRFADEPMLREWQLKDGGRVMVGIYAVTGHDSPLDDEHLATLRAEDVVQVAYGWFGATPVAQMPPGVTVTTAYRVGRQGLELARQRSAHEQRLRMGLALGRAVIGVATELYGIPRKHIGLESWRSNRRANGIYDELGFWPVLNEMAERRTLEPAGTMIDGRIVRYAGQYNLVWDERLFQVLATPEELAQMAREAAAA